MTEIHDLTATELAGRLRDRALTSVEVTQHFLDRIAAHDGELRAFVTVTPERALERATDHDALLDRVAADRPRAVPELLADFWRWKPILGLPFADKDLVNRAGVPTSYGSRVTAAAPPPAVSDPLADDLDAAGGVSLAKTNTPEFGFPSYTENAIGEPARNPWDRALGPGGSSGGAAVAVAARLLPFAPGSDGGGSIRIPAAACGLVGLKPSRGRVRGGSGLESLAGLPVAGPIARTVEDAALLLDAMTGPHVPWTRAVRAPDDGAVSRTGSYSACLAFDRELHADEPDVRLGRIAVSTWSPWAERYDLSVDDAHIRALEATARELEAAGCEIVRLPGGVADLGVGRPAREGEGVIDATGYAEAFRAVWRAGAAALPLDDAALERVEPLTAWLVRTGRELPAADLARGLAFLADFERRVIEAYGPFSAVLTPALAMSPRPVGWYDPHDGERNFAQQVQYTPFTSYLNVAGLPAISMPVANDPLPVGVQAIGRAGAESALLGLAAWLEPRFGWTERAPAVG